MQESAGNFAEDGLGADWLNLDSLGRPGAPVIVLEYSGLRACVLEEAASVSWQRKWVVPRKCLLSSLVA